jgi:hypothetical protein
MKIMKTSTNAAGAFIIGIKTSALISVSTGRIFRQDPKYNEWARINF